MNVDTRRRTIAAISILGAPALLLAINRNLFVNPSTNLLIDPWIYTGFFLNLSDQLHRFSGTYYGSRLSVLLPGSLVHASLPPLAANYALHIGLFLMLLFATYRLVRRGADPSLALLATIVMAWNPVVVAAASWDYVDGFGITLFVAALALLEAAVGDPRPRTAYAGAAGFLAGCLLTANLFLVLLIPILALFVALRIGRDDWRSAVPVGIAAAFGMVVALAAFAAASVQLGGPWWYLEPQWRESRTLVSSRNPWQLPGYAWMAYATWLVLPFTATVGAVWSCLRWLRARGPVTFGLAIQFTLLAMVALWTVVQIWKTPVLQISYYSSYLAPLSIIALTLQLEGSNERLPVDSVLAVVTTFLFAVGSWLILADAPRIWSAVVPMWLADAFARASSIGTDHSLAAGATLIGALAGLAAVTWLRVPMAMSWRWIAFVTALAVSYVAVPQFWQPASGPSAPARFASTALAHRYISEQAAGHPLRLWYRLTADTQRPFKSIASTFLWGYVLVNEELPIVTQQQAAALAPQTRLVLLVPTFEDAETARAPLRRLGLDYRVVGHREFGAGDSSTSVVITDVVRSADAQLR